ncbi:MAG: alkaline phosphatase, partial [Proteobacteria bacterium]|nr:alkaline phosphatase [Pseudomonadota bacterium]
RGWESDADLPAAARRAGCIDIARQLIETPFGHGPEVLLGGGRSNFMTAAQADPEYPALTGRRRDGRDLLAQWRQAHPGGAYVWNAAQLAEAPLDAPLLGLFEPSHMQYEHDRRRDAAGEPSLAEMTRAAIERLQRDADGYLLLVEAGRIDHAHHAGNAYRALDDTIAMSDAVAAANQLTSADDTLIVVTADHSHTLGFAGYPQRGNPILGLVREAPARPGAEAKLTRDADGLPYTTLSYGNGPGHVDPAPGPTGRPDLREVDTQHPDYLQEALVPLASESHGGDDVGIWARGPGSDAVRGSVEQNAVFHFMLQATPHLRQTLCARDLCDANGVPVELPVPAEFIAD